MQPSNLDKAQRAEQAMVLMRKAAMHIAIYHVFYGALLQRLKLRVDYRHDTMYTDAVVVGFSPEFVLGLRWEHIVYILCHEVTHCALGHPFRRKDRDPKLWNQAIDHVTNLALNKDPQLAPYFPPEGLADPRFEGMAAEQVYTILFQEREQRREEQRKQQEQQAAKQQAEGGEGGTAPEQGGSDDEEDEDQAEDTWPDCELAGAAGSIGDCLDAGASGEPLPKPDDENEDEGKQQGGASKGSDTGSDAEAEDQDGDGGKRGGRKQAQSDEGSEDAVPDPTKDVAQGAQVKDSADQSPVEQQDPAAVSRLEREWSEAVMTAQLTAGGHIEGAMQRALERAQQSRKSFAEYVDEFAQVCCSQEQSWNRPARRFKDYMPSNCVPGVKCLVIGMDTSCSMSDRDLAVGESAAQRIMEDFNLRACIVVYCDSAVRNIERFEAGEQITFENAKGGGGTRFEPVLQCALDLEQQGEELAGVIYLTDMEGSVRGEQAFRDMHILWANTNARRLGVPLAPSGLGTVCNLHDA